MNERIAAFKAKVDTFQQQHTWLAFPYAVIKRFSDDDAGKLAALIAYYAFLSIFPLLIVMVTIATKVLANNQDLAKEVIDSAAGSFLSVGSGSAGEIKPLPLSGLALVVGVMVALWAGLAVAHGMQDSMNAVYRVPRDERPSFVPRILRSVLLLIIVGLGLSLSTVIQGVVSQGFGGGTLFVILGSVIALLLNIALISLAFRRSTVAVTTWKGVLPGAVIVAIFWLGMQMFGTSLLTRKLDSSSATYGSFAIVVVLLFYFFLLAQVSLIAAEVNVVLTNREWPRSMNEDAPAEAGLGAGAVEVSKKIEGAMTADDQESPR